jgi:hypothetical protein
MNELPEQLDVMVIRCRSLKDDGASKEDVLSFLRRAGFSQVFSVMVIVSVWNVSLQEAKECVHLSPTWADRKKDNDDFHNLLDKIQG